ncbi:hypothetical protein AUJ95_06285 [Candidatus Desantisbacteria bacterium CG2_30_40_21]|uniref:Uncharacterized protein n=5 Tax=unclassified Candidatus Desantisiibacteriota TaxID=3106372 RepID=A0A2M7J9H7_9BACT|nr:MAG: hypothetical protein AUJ95_06285 [Candidatus Desantisbacteria bacterium CG2_30_40_21]PIP40370.1 MAG: hypothetical protein COX18_06915 [Candidatus Desantisbacteria bacterium CG23_combo_of_CG06-09_8_20_14_all_40_23]PIX16059.1 MAG: hypothetical protein COZ71_08655 [Candidatus Desantisbacteria bacterium CG_4_8_14_3_um_filter_40_12]PIY19519.1 MAG: hypothetical protein COZ13_04960 [Candidatus Desantisbacteria bacterium CG_4_10_14_3_um_filter_40_18]PJB28606.1 MAG: hypothetical protein CO110_09
MIESYASYIFNSYYDGPSFWAGLAPFAVGICLAISLEELVHSLICFLSNQDKLAMMRLFVSILILLLLSAFCVGVGLTFYSDVYLHQITPENSHKILKNLFLVLYVGAFWFVVYILMILWNKEQRHDIGSGGLRGLICGILLIFILKYLGMKHYDNTLLVILISGIGFLWGALGKREFLLQKWVLFLYPIEQGVLISLVFSIFVIWLFRTLYGINFENARAISCMGLWLSAISVAFTSLYISRLIRTEPFETSPYKKKRYFRIGILIFFFFWIGQMYSLMTVNVE